MNKFTYTPSGVCCRLMEVETENDTIVSVKFYGGCEGNLSGIAKLVAGQSIESVITLLKGVDCHGKGTSCPDQLARALELNR